MADRVLVTVTHIYRREAAYLRRLDDAGLDDAGLDEREPCTASPLFELDNVILSPHVAGVDETSEVAMADRAIDAILAVRRGARPAGDCLINPEVIAPRGAVV